MEELDETPAPWWSVDRFDSYVPYRERDAIDRKKNAERAGGRQQSSKMTSRRAHDVSQHRQARLGRLRLHRSASRARDRHFPIAFCVRLTRISIVAKAQRFTSATKMLSTIYRRGKRSAERWIRESADDTPLGYCRSSVFTTKSPVIRPRARPRLDLEDPRRALCLPSASARCATTNANPDQQVIMSTSETMLKNGRCSAMSSGFDAGASAGRPFLLSLGIATARIQSQ